MDQERLALLALHMTPGIGDYLFKQLISYCGSAEAVFEKPKGKLIKIPGVGEITANSIKEKSAFSNAEKEIQKSEKDGATLLFYMDKNYPRRLKNIEDAPALIYFKGNANIENVKCVGIVGTRQATEYGKEQTHKIVEQLMPHRPLIISGLAYGIDIQAHKQALQLGLQTIGVMGSGLDIMYPSVHREIASKMIHQGGLLTENHYGTKPDAHNFPARNRIIAGLCDALIIVEAAEKGGALITADIANSYHKDVFAVPGNIGQNFSEGCNKLIKTQRAHLYNSIRDLEYIMNWTVEDGPSATTAKHQTPDWSQFDRDEKKILRVLMEKSPIQIDELTWRSELSPGILASLLLNLEFKNAIESLPGKTYKLRT
jgi:DNA processing protein